jgi:hypothetical protein
MASGASKSQPILQPGPAVLTDGLDALRTIVRSFVARRCAARQP